MTVAPLYLSFIGNKREVKIKKGNKRVEVRKQERRRKGHFRDFLVPGSPRLASGSPGPPNNFMVK